MARVRLEHREYIPLIVREKVLKNSGCVCAHCGVKLAIGDNFSLEHVIPLNKGGKNDESNFVALCKTCNKEKSDDVVDPKEYYKYLPKGRLAEIQSLFDEYCKSTDWLGYDNLFKTDQFTITSFIPVFKGNGIVNVPTTFRVEKARRGDTFEFLTLYKGRLRYEDKNLIVYDENNLTTPFYRVMRGEDLIMYISPYINKLTLEEDNGYMDTRNTVYLDIFVNPELHVRRNTIPMLYNIVHTILFKVQNTLSVNRNGCDSICCVLRTPSSDKLGTDTLKEISYQSPYGFNLNYDHENKNGTGACILEACSILYMGSRTEVKRVFEQQNRAIQAGEKLTVASLVNQSSIDLRLKNAKELTVINEMKKGKEKVKKKDKKASKKKHRR